MSAGDDYAAAAVEVSRYLWAVLDASIVAAELRPLDLYDYLAGEGLLADGFPSGITITQWAAALDMARERAGLPPWGGHSVLIVGEIRDPNVRQAARQIWGSPS